MKSNTVAIGICLYLVFFATVESQAIPVQITITQEKTVDPETGKLGFLALNPDLSANLTFIVGGLQIEYKNTSGHTVRRNIFANFKMNEVDGEAPEFRKRFERMRFETVSAQGLKIIRNALVQLSEQSQAKQLPLLLYFDPKGQAGFHNTNHELTNVKIFSPIVGGDVSLEEFLFNIIRPSVLENVKASMEGDFPGKKPVGFGIPQVISESNSRTLCKNIMKSN